MGTRWNRLFEAVLTSSHNLCFEIWKISDFFLSENFPFLVVKFSIHLNRHVFVMDEVPFCDLVLGHSVFIWSLGMAVFRDCCLSRVSPYFPLRPITTVELQSLEHRWLVYRGWFELVFEFLENTSDSSRKQIFIDIIGKVSNFIKLCVLIWNL